MITVSQAYQDKMFDKVQTHKLRGTIDGVQFTDSDVIGVSITAQCADKNVVVGSVTIGTLKLTFLRDVLSRGDYYDKEIKIYDSLYLGDDSGTPIYEEVLVGTFYVGEAQWTNAGMISVTAYDALSKLDKPVTFDQSSSKLYGWLNVISQACDVPVGMTEAACQALTNGNIELAAYTENDITTYRDLLSKLAQTVAGFGYATRDGGIAVKSFTDNSILDIPKINRFSGATFSDFTTRFDAVSFNDLVGEKVWIEGDEDGYVMELGDAPFLQYGTEESRTQRVQNILNQVQQMVYTPFKVSLLPAFVILDLGDVISFTNDYTHNTSTGCVMSITWTYNKSFTVQCFGSNPNLKNAKSKTDNAVTGASRYGGGAKLATFVATNADEVIIQNRPTEVVRASFSVADNACALALFEAKFTLPEHEDEESGVPEPYIELVDVYYYIDGQLWDYQPVETYGESGLHTISLMLPIVGASESAKHNLIVKMKTTNGGAIVLPLDSRLYIQSTGVAGSSRWDGWIRAEDDLHIIPVGDLNAVSVEDLVTLTEYGRSDPDAITDTFSLCAIGYYEPITLQDTVNVFMEGGFAILLEQNDEVIRTEDNVRLITE